MKRLTLFLAPVLLLTGCAQLFDSNLFQSIDNPPKLSASDLKSADDVANGLKDPDAFYQQLKDNPQALTKAQEVLEDTFSTVTTGSTAAEKAAAVDAAQNYILVTANASDAGTIVSTIVNQASTLMEGTTASTEQAVADLFAGQTTAEITATLNQFVNMGSALAAMQTAATSGGTVSTDSFFSSGAPVGDIAQTALVAGAVTALVADYGSVAALAADLADGSLSPPSHTAIDQMADAVNGDNAATNNYAYMAAIMAALGQ